MAARAARVDGRTIPGGASAQREPRSRIGSQLMSNRWPVTARDYCLKCRFLQVAVSKGPADNCIVDARTFAIAERSRLGLLTSATAILQSVALLRQAGHKEGTDRIEARARELLHRLDENDAHTSPASGC